MFFACSENSDKKTQNDNNVSAVDVPNTEKIQTPGGDPPAYDPNRGSGKFTHVDLGKNLNISF